MGFKSFFIGLFCCVNSLYAQVIYNGYANVIQQSGTTFTVNNVNETNHLFANGDQVIIMQMQDDVIGTNTTNATSFGALSSIQSAGLWEVKTVSAHTRTSGVLHTITFSSPLTNTYNIGPNSSLQIITFRRLSAGAFTSTNNITGLAWNGFVGGVVAIEVGGNFTLAHNITANAIGFRGGAVSANYYGGGTTCTLIDYATSSTNCGRKGEGIYKITSTSYSFGIAKVLNGGGGGGQDINGGGGGGGNWTAGGVGGIGWNGTAAGCPTASSPGGQGGISLSSAIPFNRIFMGGGGGGGQQNNSASTPGGNGGGIIIVKAGTLTTTGTCGTPRIISANGASVATAGNDGAGGGGAAGSIVLQIDNYNIVSTCQLSITANGGNGGSINTSTHAGGGAGGQGIIVFSTPQPTTNVTSSTNNGSPGCNNNSSPCNSPAGSAGGSNNSGIFSNIGGALPVELIEFKAKPDNNKVLLSWRTSTERNNKLFVVEKSTDGTSFESFGTVNSRAIGGNSSSELHYDYIDFSPLPGVNYYRLKQVDLNGFSKTHKTISVNFDKLKKVTFIIIPNPSHGEFDIDFSGLENNHLVEVHLRDLKGKLVYQNSFYSNEVNGNFRVTPQEQLPLGTYICTLTIEGISYHAKVLIN